MNVSVKNTSILEKQIFEIGMRGLHMRDAILVAGCSTYTFGAALAYSVFATVLPFLEEYLGTVRIQRSEVVLQLIWMSNFQNNAVGNADKQLQRTKNYFSLHDICTCTVYSTIHLQISCRDK